MPCPKPSKPSPASPAAPTLKERGAALSAGIARVSRKAAPSADTLSGPDPVLAVITAHTASRSALDAASNADDPIWRKEKGLDTSTEALAAASATYEVASAAEDAAWNAVFATRPTTAAGLVALIRHAGVWAPGNAGLAGAPELGDIFGLIADDAVRLMRPEPSEAHALTADLIACWRDDATIPEADREDGDLLYERWYARRGALLNAAAALPATRDALTAKALAFAWIWGDDAVTQGRARADHGTDGQLILDIVAIVRGAASQDAAAAAPDPFFGAVAAARAATAAVDAFERRVAERRPEGWAREESALVAAQTRARDLALATVPTTRAGQLALVGYTAELMRAFGYADGGPPDPESSIWADAYKALSATLRAPVRTETIGRPAATEHDLSALTLNDLAHLHMMASTMWNASSMFVNAPFSWDERREDQSALGDIIEAEADRWADLASAVAEEAARRAPQDKGQRDRRLEIAAQQAMLGGGPIEDKALIADLAAAWGA